MKRPLENLSRWLLLFGVVLLWATGAGCASTETENLSERPWNAPRHWEGGLPSGMFEGR